MSIKRLIKQGFIILVLFFLRGGYLCANVLEEIPNQNPFFSFEVDFPKNSIEDNYSENCFNPLSFVSGILFFNKEYFINNGSPDFFDYWETFIIAFAAIKALEVFTETHQFNFQAQLNDAWWVFANRIDEGFIPSLNGSSFSSRQKAYWERLQSALMQADPNKVMIEVQKAVSLALVALRENAGLTKHNFDALYHKNDPHGLLTSLALPDGKEPDWSILNTRLLEQAQSFFESDLEKKVYQEESSFAYDFFTRHRVLKRPLQLYANAGRSFLGLYDVIVRGDEGVGFELASRELPLIKGVSLLTRFISWHSTQKRTTYRTAIFAEANIAKQLLEDKTALDPSVALTAELQVALADTLPENRYSGWLLRGHLFEMDNRARLIIAFFQAIDAYKAAFNGFLAIDTPWMLDFFSQVKKINSWSIMCGPFLAFYGLFGRVLDYWNQSEWILLSNEVNASFENKDDGLALIAGAIEEHALSKSPASALQVQCTKFIRSIVGFTLHLLVEKKIFPFLTEDNSRVAALKTGLIFFLLNFSSLVFVSSLEDEYTIASSRYEKKEEYKQALSHLNADYKTNIDGITTYQNSAYALQQAYRAQNLRTLDDEEVDQVLRVQASEKLLAIDPEFAIHYLLQELYHNNLEVIEFLRAFHLEEDLIQKLMASRLLGETGYKLAKRILSQWLYP